MTRRTRRRRNLQCDLVVSFCIGVFSGFMRVKNFNMSFQFWCKDSLPLFDFLNGTHECFITLECNLRSNGITAMEMRRASYLDVSFRITGTFRKHLGIRVSGQMTVARTSWLGLNFSFKIFSLKRDQPYSF